ncbi:hypothetical protein [Selenomonas sp.]|uniref:hypothetical protein n=1 Tax=Selenomonas sp. TaxID=2053611 RepID=UPI003FA22119
MAKSISELKIKIGADSSELKKELNETQRAMQTALNTKPMESATAALAGVSKETGNLIGKFQSMATVAAGAFGLASIIDGAVQAGDNIYKLSNRLNVTTAEAGNLSRILKITGGDVDSFGSAVMRLDKSLFSDSEAGEKARRTLDLFGVSLTDAGGKLLPLNEQLENLAKGYKLAKNAGVQQEFLMTTLGTKGLALAQTLEQYTEAAETAARVKGIGLDAKEMHELALDMKVMQMESQQVQLAFTSALAPVAESVFPVVIEGLTDSATWLAKNKKEVREVTAAVVKFVAAYKGIKFASGALRTVHTFWLQSRQAALASAASQTAVQTEVTAAHERQIARRIAAVERMAQRQQDAAVRAAMKANLSAEETTARIVAECTKIEIKTAETAERIAAGMRAAFAAQAQAATVAAGETTVALNGTAVAAAEAGASMTGAHTGAARSGQVAAGVERELALATTATGNAAVIAGEKNVAAKTETAIATAGATTAANAQTVATTATGNAAVTTGTKTVGAMATATTAVGSLTRAVWALMGGWLGVAAATGYAIYKLSEYGRAQQAEKDAHTYHLDGVEYIERDGRFYRNSSTAESVEAEYTNSYVTDETRKGEMATGRTAIELEKQRVERKHETPESEAAAYEKWLHSDDPEARAELERQTQNKINEDMERQQKEMLDIIAQAGGEAAHAPKEKAAPAPTNYDVEYPIGRLAADIAAGHPQGEQWMGNITPDATIQCDSYTANVYAEAGIDSIGGQSTDGIINDEAFRAAGAYHGAGGGYEPEVGDLVDFAGHVGIYMGDGMVNSRQSSGGVQTISLEEAESYFGAVQGYGSLAEATGGRTVTERRSGTREEAEAARQAQEAARKLEQGRKDALNLAQTMTNAIGGFEDTAYMQNVEQIKQDVQQKRQRINKIKESGVSQNTVDLLNKQLDEYAKAMEQQATEKWQAAFQQVANDAKRENAEVLHDYKALAEAEYAATVRKLADERKEKEKEVMRDQDDWQSKAAVSEWYYAKLAKAEEKRRQDLKKAHEQYIGYLQSEGKVAELVAHLGSIEGKTETESTLNMEGQEKLANTYVKIWKAAHGSMSGYIADTAESIYGTLSDSMTDFIRGAKSAQEVLKDFGNSVLSMIAKIAAQRLAASWVDNILGAFSGGRSLGAGATSLGGISSIGYRSPMANFHLAGGAPKLRMFAKGGIVTAPTLAMIGEAGEHEAVIPLNERNLSAIGGGQGKAPTVVVNITNKTDGKARVENKSFDPSLQRLVLDFVVDGVNRNVGGAKTNLKTALGGV